MPEFGPAWALFPLIGALSGVLAGLFGIGGGLVIVPALNFLFLSLIPVVPDAHRMHFAIGTSLAVIVVTAVSSLWAHDKRGAVDWAAFRRLVPGILVGGLAGAVFADAISHRLLEAIFGVLVVAISTYIVIGYRPPASRDLPGFSGCGSAGFLIGSLSALAGIGGGIMTVPFLLWCARPMPTAVGTAAACTLPVAIGGVAGFMLMGAASTGPVAFSTGYVFWPAVAGISVTSVLLAPAGAALAHSLPVPRLKQAFAVLLAVVGIRMLIG